MIFLLKSNRERAALRRLLFSAACFLGIFLPFHLSAQQSSNSAQQDVQKNEDILMIPSNDESVTHGKSLFGQHCSACHMVEKQIIGPALASVHGTRPTDWLVKFIRNSQKVINDPDEQYAKELFSQYNEVVMPSFEFLSDDDILSILSYIRDESMAPGTSPGVQANGNATIDQGEEASIPNSSATPAYTQDDEAAMPESSVFSGSGTFILIIFVLSLIALVISIFYLNKGRGRNKEKTNA